MSITTRAPRPFVTVYDGGTAVAYICAKCWGFAQADQDYLRKHPKMRMCGGCEKAGVELVTDEDLRVAVERALEDAGVTLEELRRQAAVGRFSSERARATWFAIPKSYSPNER